MKRNWKTPSKDRTRITIAGTTYSVPKNRARQFREAMGQPRRGVERTLTRSQFTQHSYVYED